MRTWIAVLLLLTLAAGAAVAQTGTAGVGYFDADNNTFVAVGPQGPKGDAGARGPAGTTKVVHQLSPKVAKFLQEYGYKMSQKMQWELVSESVKGVREGKRKIEELSRRLKLLEARASSDEGVLNALIIIGSIAAIMIAAFLAYIIAQPKG